MPNAQILYLETIEDLLQKGRMEDAINALLKFISPKIDLRQDVTQQSGNFNDIQRDMDRGIISREDYNLSVRQVRYALINLINLLRERAENEVVGTVPEVTNTPTKDGNTNPSKVVGPSPVSGVPKFVIVYDILDDAHCKLLNKHLNVLKFTKKIRVYNVQEAPPGEKELVNAEAEIVDADYVLALVTVNLFNSPDWFGMVFNALEQGRRVIPIRIEKADYDGTGLEKLRSLPSLGRAVSDFPNLDAAYVDIVTELRKLLPK